jgi:hypothetical protein
MPIHELSARASQSLKRLQIYLILWIEMTLGRGKQGVLAAGALDHLKGCKDACQELVLASLLSFANDSAQSQAARHGAD